MQNSEVLPSMSTAPMAVYYGQTAESFKATRLRPLSSVEGAQPTYMGNEANLNSPDNTHAVR